MQHHRQTERQTKTNRRTMLCFLGLATTVTMGTQVGCIPFIANMIHAVKGGDVPAEFPGLKEQRVALITVSDTSAYSDDVAARKLSRIVTGIIKEKVKEIQLVREDEIDQWRDTQGYSDIDYVSLGRGVKADKVVAVEMVNLRLRDGQTLYRGHADVTVTVHNVKDGSLEFRRSLDDYSYPVTAGIPVTEITEDKFRAVFLNELGKRVARFFHAYDFRDSIASDAKIASY